MFALSLALALSVRAAAAGASGADWRVLDPTRDPPAGSMLSAYLQRIAAAQLAARQKEVAAITTREHFEARRARIRTTFLQMVGGLDEKRTPLNPRTTGTLEREGYRIEKIIYESRPKFFVTANLYIPTTGPGPFPGIVLPLGHSDAGKAHTTYQIMAVGLVRHGFVVLAYDPIGQGERRVYFDPDLGDSKVGRSTHEHTMLGFQCLQAGESVARYRVWDGIRSIDLLESRPEVDPKRIGITGCSGGGTLTAYLAAVDDRLQVAAPACYMCSWQEQLLGKGPQDGEQQFPEQLKAGIDHADLIWMAAPKPYLICSTDQDPSFPLAGAGRTYNEAKQLYTLLGVAEKVRWVHEPGPHGIPKTSREAMYGWMKRWLQGGPDAPAPEMPLRLEHSDDLNVTPTGQVATSFGGETASTWNMKRYSTVAPERGELGTRADVERLRGRVREHVRQLTAYVPVSLPLEIRSRGEIQRAGFRAEKLVYRSDDGLVVPAVLCRPDGNRPRGPAIILLDQRGKAAALAPGADVEQLVQLGYPVLVIDPAGIGETAVTKHAAADWYAFGPAWVGLMTGRPLIGVRMNDIIRAVDLLAARQLLGAGVIGFARGRLGVDLLHAAVLDARITRLIVQEGLISFQAIARTALHQDIYEVTLPGVLRKYDLPDLVGALAPRPVSLVNVLSPVNKLVLQREVVSAYRPAAAAYAQLGAAGALRIGLRREFDGVADAYPELADAARVPRSE